jgi:hypothetical protein
MARPDVVDAAESRGAELAAIPSSEHYIELFGHFSYQLIKLVIQPPRGSGVITLWSFTPCIVDRPGINKDPRSAPLIFISVLETLDSF